MGRRGDLTELFGRSIVEVLSTAGHLYIVHMKRVTASEARKNWFRLLDEVASGAVVAIERGGRTILLQRAPAQGKPGDIPDYAHLIHAPDAENADSWSWDWREPGADLEPVREDGS